MIPLPVVGFCGSRSLPSSAAPLVAGVVRACLAGGSVVAVGCAAGADLLALSTVLSVGAAPRLSVFCAFGPGGVGAAGSASAVAEVAAAATAGAAVSWWAGGSASVPLRGRLAARSLALVRSLATGGGLLVAFVSALPSSPFGGGDFPACGSGSWSSVAAAVRLGVPVAVFPIGIAADLPALPGGPGSWVPGPWAGSWSWAVAPEATQLSLF